MDLPAAASPPTAVKLCKKTGGLSPLIWVQYMREKSQKQEFMTGEFI
jgi:hypothetical protein